MGVKAGPRVVSDGLVLFLDAGNIRSYVGSGNTALDLSGYGNTGYFINGTTFNSSNNGIFAFDATNDQITMGTASSVKPTQLTLACFFKINAINAPNVIVGKQGTGIGAASYALVVQNGKLNFRIESGGIQDASFTFSNTTTYNYAVGTYDGSTLKLYLNGTLVGTATTSVSIVYSDSYPLLMGYYANAFATDMRIGHIKLYNRALSAQEILQNYNATKGRYL
jgi:hypothetical protein